MLQLSKNSSFLGELLYLGLHQIDLKKKLLIIAFTFLLIGIIIFFYLL